MKMNNRAIILLSGGLDSVVSLAILKTKGINFKLALTFDYGQKASKKEINAAKEISEFYNIPHKCIKLDWLKEITNTSLVTEEKVPELRKEELNDKAKTEASMKNVWVPNRNGLFINIAASFADSYEYDYIVIGANKEESETFSDNSKKFINDINKELETSTNYEIKVIAPLIDYDKNMIIKKALELNVPLGKINSCYNNEKKHCGKCESCNRLKRALENAQEFQLINELFS